MARVPSMTTKRELMERETQELLNDDLQRKKAEMTYEQFMYLEDSIWDPENPTVPPQRNNEHVESYRERMARLIEQRSKDLDTRRKIELLKTHNDIARIQAEQFARQSKLDNTLKPENMSSVISYSGYTGYYNNPDFYDIPVEKIKQFEAKHGIELKNITRSPELKINLHESDRTFEINQEKEVNTVPIIDLHSGAPAWADEIGKKWGGENWIKLANDRFFNDFGLVGIALVGDYMLKPYTRGLSFTLTKVERQEEPLWFEEDLVPCISSQGYKAPPYRTAAQVARDDAYFISKVNQSYGDHAWAEKKHRAKRPRIAKKKQITSHSSTGKLHPNVVEWLFREGTANTGPK